MTQMGRGAHELSLCYETNVAIHCSNVNCYSAILNRPQSKPIGFSMQQERLKGKHNKCAGLEVTTLLSLGRRTIWKTLRTQDYIIDLRERQDTIPTVWTLFQHIIRDPNKQPVTPQTHIFHAALCKSVPQMAELPRPRLLFLS